MAGPLFSLTQFIATLISFCWAGSPPTIGSTNQNGFPFVVTAFESLLRLFIPGSRGLSRLRNLITCNVAIRHSDFLAPASRTPVPKSKSGFHVDTITCLPAFSCCGPPLKRCHGAVSPNLSRRLLTCSKQITVALPATFLPRAVLSGVIFEGVNVYWWHVSLSRNVYHY